MSTLRFTNRDSLMKILKKIENFKQLKNENHDEYSWHVNL